MSKNKKWAIQLDEKYESTREMLIDKIFSGRDNVALTIFAASIGLEYKKFEPTKKVKFTAAFNVGSIEEFKAHAHFLAFNHTKEKATLNSPEKCWDIVSSYANGGLGQIKEWFEDVSERPEDLELKIINEMKALTLDKLPTE